MIKSIENEKKYKTVPLFIREGKEEKFILYLEIIEELIFKSSSLLEIDDFFEQDMIDDLLGDVKKIKENIMILRGKI